MEHGGFPKTFPDGDQEEEAIELPPNYRPLPLTEEVWPQSSAERPSELREKSRIRRLQQVFVKFNLGEYLH